MTGLFDLLLEEGTYVARSINVLHKYREIKMFATEHCWST